MKEEKHEMIDLTWVGSNNSDNASSYSCEFCNCALIEKKDDLKDKKESRNWIDKMAFDVFEFVYELKERWDNLKELNRIQWEALDKANRENDFDSQTKISALLCKINDQLLQMVMILPQIAIPAKSSTLSFSQASPKPIIDIDDISNGNGNNNQSKPYVDSDLERDVS